jgi:hypothetical protein
VIQAQVEPQVMSEQLEQPEQQALRERPEQLVKQGFKVSQD